MLYDVAIIGAGVAGLAAGQVLQRANKKFVMIDKGKSPGGRLATRRIGGAIFDHGAQFFHARDSRFVEVVQSWLDRGFIREWNLGEPDSAESAVPSQGYIGQPSMNGFAKHLAADLPSEVFRLAQKVVRLTQNGSGETFWHVECESGDPILSRTLLLTAPLPQAANLLRNTAIGEDAMALANQVTFQSCLTLLILLEPTLIETIFHGHSYRRFGGDVLSWGADNYAKGVSPFVGAVTLQASPDFSRVYYNSSDEEVANSILEAAGISHKILMAKENWQLKKWRYAIPEKTLPQQFADFGKSSRILLAGDAFGHGNIEGAWLSGHECACALVDKI